MARKITYGAKGNVSKVKAKKDIPKKVDSEPEKPKRVVKEKPTTKELLNSLDTETIVKDLSTYDTPEKLKEEESEEQKLYDNSYISKDLSNYKIARDEVEIDDYLYSKLKTKALEQSEAFTDWDVKIGDPVDFFDPELSYELTGYRPITETQGLDFNPDWFTKSRDIKNITGNYTDAPPRTKAYDDFWFEEYRRCRDGYTVNGYTITGDNYYFLNYYRLPRLDETNKAGGGRSIGFPKFYAKQYEYFHYLELCRKTNKDALVLKGRGLKIPGLP